MLQFEGVDSLPDDDFDCIEDCGDSDQDWTQNLKLTGYMIFLFLDC